MAQVGPKKTRGPRIISMVESDTSKSELESLRDMLLEKGESDMGKMKLLCRQQRKARRNKFGR